MAENYLNKNNLVLAEKSVKRALELAPESQYGMRVLASTYRQKAEAENQEQYLTLAQSAIEKVLKVNSNDTMVNGEAAQIYLAQGNKAKALQAIQKAIGLAPKNKYLQDIKAKIESMP